MPRRESELALDRFHGDARRRSLMGAEILPPQLAQAAEELSGVFAFAREDLPTVSNAERSSRRPADAITPPPTMSGGDLAERVGALLASRRGTTTQSEEGQ